MFCLRRLPRVLCQLLEARYALRETTEYFIVGLSGLGGIRVVSWKLRSEFGIMALAVSITLFEIGWLGGELKEF